MFGKTKDDIIVKEEAVYEVTYKCLNCNEIITLGCTNNKMIDEFAKSDKTVGRYWMGKGNAILHKCNDGCIGNCLPIKYKEVGKD